MERVYLFYFEVSFYCRLTLPSHATTSLRLCNPTHNSWQLSIQHGVHGSSFEFRAPNKVNMTSISYNFIYSSFLLTEIDINSLFLFSVACVCSLCCQCGVLTTPNPSNMCVGCLRSQVDITEGIPKQSNLHFCKACERYDAQFKINLK